MSNEAEAYPGQSLGLPESGRGSLASWRARFAALIVDWADAEVITRDRAFAVMLGVIGACLTVVGVHALAGVRRGIDPAVPTATVRPR